MLIPASASRIASARGGRLLRGSLLLNHDAYTRGLNLDPVDIEIQIERLVDLHVGIARLNEVLHQKIEDRSVDHHSRKFDAGEEHGTSSIRRLDSNGNLQWPLTFNQAGD